MNRRIDTPITPDGVPVRACLGVFMWRMLGELHTPLLRRRGDGSIWRRALRAEPSEKVIMADPHDS